MGDILSRVIKIVSEHAGDSAPTPDCTFSDLGFDSLDSVEVAMALEEEFGIDVPDGQFNDQTTPRMVEAFIKEKNADPS